MVKLFTKPFVSHVHCSGGKLGGLGGGSPGARGYLACRSWFLWPGIQHPVYLCLSQLMFFLIASKNGVERRRGGGGDHHPMREPYSQ